MTPRRAWLRAWVDRQLSDAAPARHQRLRLARRAVEANAPRSGDVRVLDAGCQTGLLALALARAHPSWSVVAADLDANALNRVWQAVCAEGISNVEPVRSDLTRPLELGSFDVVTAIECLAEIPDDVAVLANLASVLRPGGTLVVHVPRAGWRPVLRGSPGQWYDNVRSGYEPSELRRLLQAAGLEVTGESATTRSMLHLAEEIRFRWLRRAPNKAQLAALPLLRLAAWLEDRGLTWGPPRGLLLIARRT